MNKTAKDLNVGDIVRVCSGAYGIATVIAKNKENVQFLRPYLYTDPPFGSGVESFHVGFTSREFEVIQFARSQS